MHKDGSNRIEHLKTAVLVVLFVTTILLLYLLWSLDAQGSFHLPDILPHREAQNPPDTDLVVVPDSVVYGMGDGSFRRERFYTTEIFKKSILHLKALHRDPALSVTEITKEQFSSALMEYRSSAIYFSYGIPFRELCSRNDMPFVVALDAIRTIDVLAFSEASPESMFVADSTNEHYYRLHAPGETDRYADMAESEESITLSVCYTIGNILGGDNQELMPLFEESSLMPVRWKSDSEETSQSIRLLLLESLFGENLDFVRRIADNAGNVTYLYGYGKKTFTYQSDGVLEYKNEAADATAGGFYKDLETALSFAAVNGLWDGAEASGLRLTLRNAEVISNGKQEGYRFGFGAHIAEHPLYYEAGLPLIVEVLDGQVSYLRSDMIAVERMPAHGQEKPVQDPANVIARNYNHIYNVSTGNVLSVNQDIAFQYVVSSVRDVRVGLVRLLNNEWLQPAWILETRGGQRFYFSLYEAIPIGTGK